LTTTVGFQHLFEEGEHLANNTIQTENAETLVAGPATTPEPTGTSNTERQNAPHAKNASHGCSNTPSRPDTGSLAACLSLGAIALGIQRRRRSPQLQEARVRTRTRRG